MVAIPRTESVHWPQSTFAHDVRPDTDVAMTIWLRPRQGGDVDAARALQMGETPPGSRRYDDRRALRERTKSDDGDAASVREYLHGFGIEAVEDHWRSFVARGTLGNFIKAFDADVEMHTDAIGRTFRSRAGPLSAPEPIASIVRGVFGFSQWPHARRLGALGRHATPLSAGDIASRYAFPAATGAGQTIAILQMGGDFRGDDFERCMQSQGVHAQTPVVKRIDDPTGPHAAATAADLESALDSQIAAALAPGSRIVIYRGPDSERSFLGAVRRIVFEEEYDPSILSISYGWPEMVWTPAAIDILNELFAAAALLGISIFCASGDNGAGLSYDTKPHVLFPASSPFVHACGATAIDAADASRESAWQHTGGGFSEQFEMPAWQRVRRLGADAAGRAVPDIAAQESPGYCVYLQNVELAAGGTSAVAPMWAALAARLNERLGSRLGFFAPMLYRTNAQAFRDVTVGGNGYFQAGAGWNPCTGLGVPIGTALESALRVPSA